MHRARSQTIESFFKKCIIYIINLRESHEKKINLAVFIIYNNLLLCIERFFLRFCFIFLGSIDT